MIGCIAHASAAPRSVVVRPHEVRTSMVESTNACTPCVKALVAAGLCDAATWGMRNELGTYRVVDLTPGRRAWLNTMDLGGPAHTMVGLLEIDVSVAKRLIDAHRTRTGETLSFTGFLIACLARAVAENKDVQTYRKGRKRLVVFDDVHVGMLIEHAGGTLMGHVIHHANRKTYREIHDEIRRVQAEPPPATRGMPGWFRRIMLLPWPLSSVAKRVLRAAVRRDPTIIVGSSGTVFVTAVGMFGGGHSGWGITEIPTSLSLVVGGINDQTQMLSLTVQLDHEVIDGAPATRFIRRLVELIEQPEWAITGAHESVLDPDRPSRRVLEELH